MAATHDWERFRRFLTWNELVAGGTVTQPCITGNGAVRWTDGDGVTWHLDPITGRRGVSDDPDGQNPQRDARWGPREIRPPSSEGAPAVGEALSPDGMHVLTEIDHELAVRDIRTGATRILTSGGSADLPWRVDAQAESLIPAPPVWSPDGSRVLSLQADLTGLDQYPLVDWSTYPPAIQMHPYQVEGRPRRALSRAAFVSVATGEIVLAKVEDGARFLPLRWTTDGDAFLAITYMPDGILSVIRLDAADGTSETIVQERIIALHAYLPAALSAALTPVPDFDGFGWTSDRDGTLRLYVARSGGGDMIAVTPEGTQVSRVVGPTADGGVLLLARTDPNRPYDLHICRTDARGAFKVLTDLPGTHDATLLGDGSLFLDAHSSLDRPPRTDLWNADGTHVAVLETANIAGVKQLGRGAAESFVVKAADGVTDLYGVLFQPPGFDPRRSYPVIDCIYAGPQTISHLNRYSDPPKPSGSVWTSAATLAEAFAQLGFVGIVLDARGTPGRGRSFQEAAADEFGTIAVRDHVAAITGLAAERPWLDPTRCGAIGLSFGGYHAARCGLLAPQVFRAIVAAAGPYDLEVIAPGWFERLLGASYSADPQRFADAGLVTHAADFRSELMLVHGTHDVNVPLVHTMRFSDALMQAGRQHELVILQNESHQITGTHQLYALESAARFFLRHLLA
ncbi:MULTISPECIES: prolyl oligopeptidase family serine peptidase [unclassified Nonomuraea]|uniref:S9 family peptidase n=1 Tax=unclassified Nonomuraea TaxID=2593643 RepID=UPI0033F19361